MTLDSPAIAISVSPGANKAKSTAESSPEDDASAFSISLEIAREEADGETTTTSITVQGLPSESAEAAPGSPAHSTSADDEVTIEIETVVFSGDDLAENLTASTVLGGGLVAATGDGGFGVNGSVSGGNEVRLEVGETLTFALPPTEGEVVGGQVTITNLYCDGETNEGALVIAYDADDRQLASYCVIGNETGSVTLDIDVPFARLDFKALDNDSLLLENNSNFGVSDISALIASVVEDLGEGASQLIDKILTEGGSQLAKLVDLGHFGKVHFEVTRVSTNAVSTIDSLSGVQVDFDRESIRQDDHRSRQGVNGSGIEPEHAAGWPAAGGLAV